MTEFVLDNSIDEGGRSLYSQWLHGLNDTRTKARISLQVDKMALNLFGDGRSIGNGLSELRIHFGSGYRVYFGKEGTQIILLLCGDDKVSQVQDIKQAKKYWENHKRRHNHDT